MPEAKKQEKVVHIKEELLHSAKILAAYSNITVKQFVEIALNEYITKEFSRISNKDELFKMFSGGN